MKKLDIFSWQGCKEKLQKAIQDYWQSPQSRSRVQKAPSTYLVMNQSMATACARTNTSRWQRKLRTVGGTGVRDSTSRPQLLNRSGVTKGALSILRQPGFPSSQTSQKEAKYCYTLSFSHPLCRTTSLTHQGSQWPGMPAGETLADAKEVGPIHCTLVPLCRQPAHISTPVTILYHSHHRHWYRNPLDFCSKHRASICPSQYSWDIQCNSGKPRHLFCLSDGKIPLYFGRH